MLTACRSRWPLVSLAGRWCRWLAAGVAGWPLVSLAGRWSQQRGFPWRPQRQIRPATAHAARTFPWQRHKQKNHVKGFDPWWSCTTSTEPYEGNGCLLGWIACTAPKSAQNRYGYNNYCSEVRLWYQGPGILGLVPSELAQALEQTT